MTIPPRLPLRFFRWFCHPKLLKYIEGDLMELYEERQAKSGKLKADLRFVADVLLLFRPGIIKPTEGYKNLNTNAMLQNYFKIGWRNLLRNKGYSLINIGGLAMGITVTMLIGLWMHHELSANKNFKNYNRIAQVIQNVTNNGEVQTWKNVPFPLAEELRTNYGSDFKHIVMAVQWGDHMLSFNDKKLKEVGGYFERELPDMLGLEIIQGSANLSEPASILLSENAANVFFGTDDPLNKVMKIDDMPVVKVVGVFKDIADNSRFTGLHFISTWDFLYSNSDWMKTSNDPWRPNFTTLFVQLNDNVDFQTVSARIKDAKLKKINPELAKKKPELFLHPMSQWRLYSEFKNGVNVGGAIQYVWLFGTIGSFVLLLACINFMNLSTARNEKRAKEVGIRKTVGSVRRQLIVQFFSESLLTVLIAFALALVMVQLALPFFNQLANKQISIVWSSPVFWMVCFGFAIATAIVAGSYPALYLSSIKPVKVLKGTFKAGRFAVIPRKVLVVLQFTVSVTLIIGTIIVYQQIQFGKNRPVGYSRNHLISVPMMNSAIHDHMDAVKNELTQSRTITSMAESQSPTTGIWNSSSGFSWKGKDPDQSIDFGNVNASWDFGKTIDWKIKEGRDFSRDFPSDSSALILNEAAVHFMGLKNPIGETVTWWGRPLTVVGVIHDMIIESPYDETRPVIYSLDNGAGNVAILKLNPAIGTQEAIQKIESVFKKNNPDQPFEYQFVDEEYAKKFNDEERIGKLASLFTTLAVVISCVGIFGLASFTAEQRTKEIGIRKVMGASISTLWQMLSKDFVVLVTISCLISIPAAWYFMQDWLLKYEYRTEISGWIFFEAAASALIITLLTVSYQAIRAAMANPVKSLRSE